MQRKVSVMTPEQAREMGRPVIEVGKRYEFYSEVQQEYEPAEKRLRRFTGQIVTVLASMPAEDVDSSNMFRVRADDGTEFEAWEEELNGWDRDLGQFFWLDATYGPNHDKQFLINEKGSA